MQCALWAVRAVVCDASHSVLWLCVAVCGGRGSWSWVTTWLVAWAWGGDVVCSRCVSVYDASCRDVPQFCQFPQLPRQLPALPRAAPAAPAPAARAPAPLASASASASCVLSLTRSTLSLAAPASSSSAQAQSSAPALRSPRACVAAPRALRRGAPPRPPEPSPSPRGARRCRCTRDTVARGTHVWDEHVAGQDLAGCAMRVRMRA